MDPPGEYFDPIARLYDAHVATADDESVSADVAFYSDLASEVDGSILELGAGTGRIYLELLATGLDIDGIDISERMLDQLRANAERRNLDANVWQADLTTLDTDRSYDLIYAPNRVFNHVTTLDDQRAALRNIQDALAPGGTFELNTFVPRFEAVVESYGSTQENHVTVDGTTYRIEMTTTLDDEIEQVARLHQQIYRDDTLTSERETPFALIPKRQFELLFELAGFDDWRCYGGFDRSNLDASDQEMVWLVEA